jgi:hypothetical protein
MDYPTFRCIVFVLGVLLALTLVGLRRLARRVRGGAVEGVEEVTTVVTMYLLHSSLLFCGEVVTPDTVPWVAMPVETYGVEWQCGDRIAIYDGVQVRVFTALDAGPFGRFCVRQPSGECYPIAADVPEPWAWFPGLSTTAKDVYSLEPIRERWEEFR